MPELVIRYRTVERITFSIVIMVLVALSLFLWLRQPSCDAGAETTSEELTLGQGTESPEAEADEAVTENVTRANETCSDGKKNQDETDLDCGGVCAACADGKGCLVADDCRSGSCVSGKCMAAPRLTGTVDATFSAVEHDGTRNTSAKVTGIGLSLFNGKSSAVDLRAELFVKTASDAYFLNQVMRNELGGDEKPYATIAIPRIASGESLAATFDVLQAVPLWSPSDRYRPQDGFLVEVRLFDTVTEERVATLKKKVTV